MSESRERNYLVGLLAENHEISQNIAGEFGKPGQKTDLFFYDRLDLQLNAVFCAIDALAYPDKIKSLIHTMMLTDFHILIVDNDKGITPAIGEIMILMDIFTKEYNKLPYIVISNINPQNEYALEENEKKIKQFIQNLSIKSAKIMCITSKEDRNDLKQLIYENGKNIPFPTLDKEKTVVDIDHCFPVKGIGTVILGLVKTGQVEASKMLTLITSENKSRKVIIRSIQKQDRDYKTAEAGDRVGLAIKGISSDEIDRGDLLTAPNLFDVSKKLNIEASMTHFYKGKLSPDDPKQFHIFIGLASSPMKVVAGKTINPGEMGKIEVELSNAVPYPLENGKGIIAELNKFDNKLRVVGFFKIL